MYYQLYRFGGNKAGLLLGGLALLLGLITLFGAFTLDDAPICTPPFLGAGQPNTAGQVVVGQVVEREQKLDGCQMLALRVRGNSIAKFTPGQQSFEAAASQPPVDVVLVLRNLPARYSGLPIGTKLTVLYDASSEAPYALSFPTGPTSGVGLEVGPDVRADYGKTRLLLYAIGGVMLLVGASILLIARQYPVRHRDLPARPPSEARRRPRRRRADPITGEPLDSED